MLGTDPNFSTPNQPPATEKIPGFPDHTGQMPTGQPKSATKDIKVPPPALPKGPLTQQQKEYRVELGFISSLGCFTFLLATLSPMLTFTLLGVSTISLGLSIPYWNSLGNLSQEPQIRQLEIWEKTLYGTAVAFATLLLTQFYPVFQLFLCTLIGVSLSYFFVDECVLRSREELNKALRNAVKEGNIELVKKALTLGADPLAPDLESPIAGDTAPQATANEMSTTTKPAQNASTMPTRNTAIHLAIQNHAHASEMLQLFTASLKVPMVELKDAFKEFRAFFNADNQTNFVAWLNGVKALWQDPRNSARREFLLVRTTGLLAGYVETIKNVVLKFSDYLRGEFAYTTLTTNSTGADPLKLLANLDIAEELKTSIKEKLNEINTILAKKAQERNPATAEPTTANHAGSPADPAGTFSEQELLALIALIKKGQAALDNRSAFSLHERDQVRELDFKAHLYATPEQKARLLGIALAQDTPLPNQTKETSHQARNSLQTFACSYPENLSQEERLEYVKLVCRRSKLDASQTERFHFLDNKAKTPTTAGSAPINAAQTAATPTTVPPNGLSFSTSGSQESQVPTVASSTLDSDAPTIPAAPKPNPRVDNKKPRGKKS